MSTHSPPLAHRSSIALHSSSFSSQSVPVQPHGQSQAKPPSAFTQTPSFWQGSTGSAHSSRSISHRGPAQPSGHAQLYPESLHDGSPIARFAQDSSQPYWQQYESASHTDSVHAASAAQPANITPSSSVCTSRHSGATTDGTLLTQVPPLRHATPAPSVHSSRSSEQSSPIQPCSHTQFDEPSSAQWPLPEHRSAPQASAVRHEPSSIKR